MELFAARTSKNKYAKTALSLLFCAALIFASGAAYAKTGGPGRKSKEEARREETIQATYKAQEVKLKEKNADYGSTVQRKSKISTAGQDQRSKAPEIDCLSWKGLDMQTCVVSGAQYIGHYIMGFFSWALWAAGQLFNFVLNIQNVSFQNQSVVIMGWSIIRDITNIFYIFILLIIAIATILQISSYSMKALLPKLLISALLVNFSLPITGVVIDASNALGNSIYKSAAGANNDISAQLVGGFKPQKLLDIKENVVSKGMLSSLADVGIAYFMGIILMAIATFVMIAAMIFLLIRIVALWLVLIFSPMAFLFFVLPSTQGWAREWTGTLFRYSLFYPAYMFMIYIVITAIKSGVVGNMFRDATITTSFDAQSAGIANSASSFMSDKIYFILQYVFLAILLIASLIVANKLGIYGSSAIINKGKSMGKSAGNYAKGKAKQLALNNSFTQGQAKNVTEGRGAAGLVGKIPLVGNMAKRRASIMQEKADEHFKKKTAFAKHLPDDTAKGFITSRVHSAKERVAMFKNLDAKKQQRVIAKMTPDEQERFAKLARGAAPQEKLHEGIADKITDPALGVKIKTGKTPENTNPDEFNALVQQHIAGLKNEDRKNMFNAENISGNKHVQNYIIDNFSAKSLQQMSKSFDQAKALGGLEMFQKDKREELRKINKKLADYLDGSPGASSIILSRLKEGKPLGDDTKAEKAKKQKPDSGQDQNKRPIGFVRDNEK